jgi:hypothetical protein
MRNNIGPLIGVTTQSRDLPVKLLANWLVTRSNYVLVYPAENDQHGLLVTRMYTARVAWSGG